MKKSKTNPRRVPCSRSYAEKRFRDGTDFGLYAAWVIMFKTLAENMELEKDTLRYIFDSCEDVAQSIRDGYCNIDDWATVLADEYDIRISKKVLHK